MQFQTALRGTKTAWPRRRVPKAVNVTLSCAVCGAQLGIGMDAYVLRRQIIGPGVTDTIKEAWLCSRACVFTHLRFRET